MKFFIDGVKDFGVGLASGFLLFGVMLGVVLLVMLPFLVPLYFDSLMEGHLSVYYVFLLCFATIFVEMMVFKAFDDV